MNGSGICKNKNRDGTATYIRGVLTLWHKYTVGVSGDSCSGRGKRQRKPSINRPVSSEKCRCKIIGVSDAITTTRAKERLLDDTNAKRVCNNSSATLILGWKPFRRHVSCTLYNDSSIVLRETQGNAGEGSDSTVGLLPTCSLPLGGGGALASSAYK